MLVDRFTGGPSRRPCARAGGNDASGGRVSLLPAQAQAAAEGPPVHRSMGAWEEEDEDDDVVVAGVSSGGRRKPNHDSAGSRSRRRDAPGSEDALLHVRLRAVRGVLLAVARPPPPASSTQNEERNRTNAPRI